ncbi:MAG: class I SAM-dependent methyltransferase [Gemmatimonadota bacterium]|nr:class I SAM-dependent methyltransferase [Gemmatimonadota bacterium]
MPLGLQPSHLREQFGDIDIYLFDQLLRGRIGGHARVLDAGCGAGRNLIFLARAGINLYGVDDSADAIASAIRQLAQSAPDFDPSHLSVESVESLSFGDGSMDVVISSAVLHFAQDDRQFHACVTEMWRVLAPGGMLFCRLASTIGIENAVRAIGGRRHVLPDGSTRYLVDEALLMETTSRLGGTLLDPLKTTVVQGMRAMTTWVLKKG